MLETKKEYFLFGDGSFSVVVEQLSRILRTTNPEIATILPPCYFFSNKLRTNPELLFQTSSEENFFPVLADKTP